MIRWFSLLEVCHYDGELPIRAERQYMSVDQALYLGIGFLRASQYTALP
jgi:hypothetical protein